MPTLGEPYEHRVTILLAHEQLEGHTEEPIPAVPTAGEWGTREYRDARAQLAELDASEIEPQPVDPDLMQSVMQRLVARGGVAAAGAGAAPYGGGSFVSLDDWNEMPPPEGVPFCIPQIGVISAPAPDGDVGAVRAALEDIPEVRLVHTPGVYRKFAAFETIGYPAAEGLGEVAYYADHLDSGREWLEALLEANAAAETMPWGVDRVRAPIVWARGVRGAGVRVAVVDTGVGPHIDLPRPLAGRTFVPGSNSWFDDNGHGTHVAGTIAGLQNGSGVIGVAPRADLIVAKVLNAAGSGSWDWIAAGIVWAADQGAHVINLSLGGSGFSPEIQRALVYARMRKVTICAATGNDGSGQVGYPARDPLCIAVGATDRSNRRAGFSQFGPELDLMAPGVGVLSSYPGNAYRELNGTSMATPHVAGVVALLLSHTPLEPTQVERRLKLNAAPLGPATQYGAGLVQADRAILTPRPGSLALPLVGIDGGDSHPDGGAAAAPPPATRRQPARSK